MDNIVFVVLGAIFFVAAVTISVIILTHRKKINRYINKPFLRDPEYTVFNKPSTSNPADGVFGALTLADVYWDIGGTNYAIQALQRWGYIPRDRFSLSDLELKVEDIQAYQEAGENSYKGVINNLKGTVGELWRRDNLRKQGMPGIDLAESRYQKGYDLIDNETGYREQVKVTKSASYVKQSLEANPDIKHSVTDNVIEDFEGDDRVLPTGFTNEAAESYTRGSLDGLADYADDFFTIGLAVYIPTEIWRNYNLVLRGDISWLRATENFAVGTVARGGSVVVGASAGALVAGKLIDTSDGIDSTEFLGGLAAPLIGIMIARKVFKGITDRIKIGHFKDAQQKLCNELQNLAQKVERNSTFYWNIEEPVHQLHLDKCQKKAILKEAGSFKNVLFPNIEYALKKDAYDRTRKLYKKVNKETNVFKKNLDEALQKQNYIEAGSLIYLNKDRLLRGLGVNDLVCRIDEYSEKVFKEYRNLQAHGMIKNNK